MTQTQKQKPTLGRKNTRQHWALYVLDAFEAKHGREEGATAEDVWKFIGGGESEVFTSRADAGEGLYSAFDNDFVERRTVEGEWDGPKLIAYRLSPVGISVLQDAGKPTKLPNRKRDGYTRDLPVEPEHDVRDEVQV